MEKKYILTHYKKEILHEEMDFDVRDKLLGDCEENEKDWDEHGRIQKFDDTFWWGESTEIDIDLVMKSLQELKDVGCNYVEIMHHEDHHGYAFVGAEIRLATKEEIEEEEKRVEEKNAVSKQKQISDLEAKLNELKK